MTAISVTDYVLSVISDSKYGGDIEWVKANLDPRHVRRIEAEYIHQQREEAVTDLENGRLPEGYMIVSVRDLTDAVLRALKEVTK